MSILDFILTIKKKIVHYINFNFINTACMSSYYWIHLKEEGAQKLTKKAEGGVGVRIKDIER